MKAPVPPTVEEARGESDTLPELELEPPLVCPCRLCTREFCDGVLTTTCEDEEFWLAAGLNDEAVEGSGVTAVCDDEGSGVPPATLKERLEIPVVSTVPPVVFTVLGPDVPVPAVEAVFVLLAITPVPVALPLEEVLVFPAAETEPTDELPVAISFTAL